MFGNGSVDVEHITALTAGGVVVRVAPNISALLAALKKRGLRLLQAGGITALF
jgi:hypothetical protein